MEKQLIKWKLKGCPRCKGDLYYESYFNDWICLQCGYYVEEKIKIIKRKLIKL